MNTACRVSFLLQRFFTERLINQRNVSSHTIACYRDTFRLLLEFIHRQRHRVPSQLTWEDFDAPLIHMLRHTTAMALLQGGVDTSSIALWLGHESPATTHIYLDANLALKEQILAKMGTWDGTKTGRYRPEDPVLKFLKSL